MQRIILALLLLATPFVFAQNTQPTNDQLALNDQHVLQYALLLERLEYTFYNTYQSLFTADNFTAAGLTATDYSYFNLIRDHERAHVNFLTPLVPNPGDCTYNFGVTSVASYIAVAALLENTGVSAYDGAINRIYSKATQTAAATIATVEARHASYLNDVNNRIPFPAAYDTALTPQNVADAVFSGPNAIATCNFSSTFALPVVYTVIPVANQSDSSQPTPQTLLANDVKVLQYALFLEHLESAFYNFVVATFNSTLAPQDAQYINLIQQHEASHVSALNSTIYNLGSVAGPACQSYNFSTIVDIASVFATGSVLENTGVYAYNGAVSAINDNALKQIAATIVTVEARHASYLNVMAGTSQGPVQGGNSASNGAYDNAFNFSTIVAAVAGSGLLGNCSEALSYVTPFSVLVVRPYTNSTIPTSAPAPTSAPTTAGPTAGPTTAGPTAGPTTAGPTAGPTTAGPTNGPTSTPTVAPTTGPTTSPTVAPTAAPTTRPTTSATTTSDATIASISVAAILLVALAAF